MTEQMSILLKQLRFFAYHGIHKEERVLGGEFEVNATVEYAVQNHIDGIDTTIDYTMVFNIVKERMMQPTDLLETVAISIAREIFAKFSIAHAVTIAIDKLHPPIKSFQGSVGVVYKLNR